MEKALIVGLKTNVNRANFEDSLKELKSLSRTAGAHVVKTITQERSTPDPATFIGKGKAEELKGEVRENEVGLILFDSDLSPTQQRNIEEITDVKIVDRTALILDIFAEHATSSAGKIQVELAQYNYILPRLTRMWTHLSRLGGGIGTRGPGETQLEVDRRRIQYKIIHLKKQLKKVERTRDVQRKRRSKAGLLQIALVGYTNSGKSSLINALTDSDVKTGNLLFSTLDPTTRRVKVGQATSVITDTVGFINNLPHQLVEAFKSTLEEVVQADILLKVADSSVENLDDRIAIVDKVLDQIGAQSPTLLVINKVDLLTSKELEGLKTLYPNAVFISALKGAGLVRLKKAIDKEQKNLKIKQIRQAK